MGHVKNTPLSGMLWVLLVSADTILPSLAGRICDTCSGTQYLWFANSALNSFYTEHKFSWIYLSNQRLWRATKVSKENKEGWMYSGGEKRGIRGRGKAIFRWNLSFYISKQNLDLQGGEIIPWESNWVCCSSRREVNSFAPSNYVTSPVCLFLSLSFFSSVSVKC